MKGRAIVALVIDLRIETGARNATKINADGTQRVALRVASPDGGWLTVADTAIGGGEPLTPGDAVAWIPLQYLDIKLTPDPRSAWVGLIAAKLAPETSDDGLKVIAYY